MTLGHYKSSRRQREDELSLENTQLHTTQTMNAKQMKLLDLDLSSLTGYDTRPNLCERCMGRLRE